MLDFRNPSNALSIKTSDKEINFFHKITAVLTLQILTKNLGRFYFPTKFKSVKKFQRPYFPFEIFFKTYFIVLG